MICCLCFDCCLHKHKNLYEPTNDKEVEMFRKTKIFDKTSYYFEKLLMKNILESEQIFGQNDIYCSVICEKCWQHIIEFDRFRTSVEAAQTQRHLILKQQQIEEEAKEEHQQQREEKQFEQIFQTENSLVVILNEQETTVLDINNLELTEQITTDECQNKKKEVVLKASNANIKNQKTQIKSKKKSIEIKLTKTKCNKKKYKIKQTGKIDLNEDKSSEETTSNICNVKQRLKKTPSIADDSALIEEPLKGALKCDLCAISCKNFKNLRQHFQEKHDQIKPYAVCCGRKYHYRFHFYDHLHVHKDPQYFKCKKCDKCFPNRRVFNNHGNSKHPSTEQLRRFECEICKKCFSRQSVLIGHMDTHATGKKDFKCNDCDKSFVLEKQLKRHINNCHNIESNGVCEQCGRKFRGRYALKTHLLQHEGITKKKWPCDLCNAELYSKFNLSRHKRLAHHDKSTVYVCSECGKISLTEDALRSHKRYMHEKERKYKCAICAKAFKVATVLKEHMSTHTGEELYKCPHCPKTFKVNANMHHHRKRVHPKEWEENRQHRSLATNIDMSQISCEVIM